MTLIQTEKDPSGLGIYDVIQALTTEYNDVYSLNLPADHVTIFRFSGHAMGVKEQLNISTGYEMAMHTYIMKNVYEEDWEMMKRMTRLDQMVSELRKNDVYTVHYRVMRNNEIHYFIMKAVRVGKAEDFEDIILGFANEDHVRESAATLRAIEFDDLTGLYTQRAFFHHVEHTLKNNPNTSYHMVLSDIENFKRINERYGRAVGDEILKIIARKLREKTDSEIIIGRYGSDQFVALFRREWQSNFVNLCHDIQKDLPVDNLPVKFGIYENVEHDVPASVLCDRILITLGTIKRKYGVNIAVYGDDIKRAEEQKNQIEENMQIALEKKQFQVYYQPKYDLRKERIAGAEALVRWIHPKFGFMNPGTFIPLFETNCFIKQLDWYVWRTVCEDLSHWIGQGNEPIPVSVNVSRLDFSQQDLTDTLIEMVDSYGLDHSLFHIEVTESCYTENPEMIVESVNVLHDAGFVIELDDFGTGYSSLTSLSSMPIDILKLDMSLIQKDDPNSDRNILKFAMQLAGILNMKVVQEGVETEEQMERIKALGCDYYQGYYYCRPLPKEQFENFLRKSFCE